ncbi:MAG: OmpH family outer membrane protein [Actinomycetota bacterium]|nr:OmpH family outer membrane protein [Actinomycetota bacterium]
MKRFSILMALLFAAAISAPLFAPLPALAGQQKAGHTTVQPLKLAVFDLSEVMKDSKVVKGYSAQIEASAAKKKKALEDKEADIKGMQARLKSTTLSPSQRSALKDKIDKTKKNMERMGEDFQTDIENMQRDTTERVLKEVSNVIKQIVAKDNYSMIFESRSVAFAQDSLDITKEIVAMYDKEYSK